MEKKKSIAGKTNLNGPRKFFIFTFFKNKLMYRHNLPIIVANI